MSYFVLRRPERKVDVIINMDASTDVQKDSFQERLDQTASRRCMKFTKRNPELKPGTDPDDPDRFRGLYAQVYDGVPLSDRPKPVNDSYGHTVTNPAAAAFGKECTMVFLPLLPNEAAVKGFDPSTAKYSGSYNLVWTGEQVQMLVDVCKANYKAGEEVVKEALMSAYLRKKREREERESGVGR